MEVKQYVVFEVNNEKYGINIVDIQEIILYQKVTKLPNSLSYIAGIINHRNKIIPIIDLNKRFGSKNETIINIDTKILLLINNEQLFGVIVDDASNIIKLDDSQIESVSDLINNIAIENIGKVDNDLISLLNVNNLVNNKKAV